MSDYLCRVIEEHRVDSEAEADELINKARESHIYDLSKSSIQKKEVKEKGEIVDEYYFVSLSKYIQNPKEPELQVELKYEV